MLKKYKDLFLPSALLSISLVFFINYLTSDSPKPKTEKATPSPPQVTQTIGPKEELFPHTIKRNKALYTHLTELGVSSIDVIDMVNATKPVKDLSRLTPGTRFKIIKNESNELTEALFSFSAIEKLKVKKTDGDWKAEVIKEPITVQEVSFKGEVTTSLWESAIDSNMDPYLITALAEVFGWVVDFNREVRVGDKWRITAEAKMAKGKRVGWGSISAAEYINSGQSHQAILFTHEGEEIGYYNLKGDSLRKMFLKSPLRFGRVTSRFNKRRFHPKLKRIRPHNGVDYGAPIGTPVRSVADGRVTFAKHSGGGGKVLKIRHSSKYKTAYKHLSRYAKGIKKGTKVRQGQVVAYVGNTGLSTGPHLHYEFFVNNRFVDPLKQKFPSAKPLAKKYQEAFAQQAEQKLAGLPKWAVENLILLSGEKTSEGSLKESPQIDLPLKTESL